MNIQTPTLISEVFEDQKFLVNLFSYLGNSDIKALSCLNRDGYKICASAFTDRIEQLLRKVQSLLEFPLIFKKTCQTYAKEICTLIRNLKTKGALPKHWNTLNNLEKNIHSICEKTFPQPIKDPASAVFANQNCLKNILPYLENPELRILTQLNKSCHYTIKSADLSRRLEKVLRKIQALLEFKLIFNKACQEHGPKIIQILKNKPQIQELNPSFASLKQIEANITDLHRKYFPQPIVNPVEAAFNDIKLAEKIFSTFDLQNLRTYSLVCKSWKVLTWEILAPHAEKIFNEICRQFTEVLKKPLICKALQKSYATSSWTYQIRNYSKNGIKSKDLFPLLKLAKVIGSFYNHRIELEKILLNNEKIKLLKKEYQDSYGSHWLKHFTIQINYKIYYNFLY